MKMIPVSKKSGADGLPDGLDNFSNTDSSPEMTSNTAPSGVASATTQTNNPPYTVLDQYTGTNWQGDGTAIGQHWQYKFDTAIACNKFRWLGGTTPLMGISASNTGAFAGEEVILLSGFKIPASPFNVTCINDTPYLYYRFSWTTSGTATISDLRFIETQPKPYNGEPSGLDNPSEVTAVPVMTSNTAPSGEAAASSVAAASREPWYAFNGEYSSSRWSSATGQYNNQWIQYKFDAPIALNKLSISPRPDSVDTCPKSWLFYGSDTGAFAGEETLLYEALTALNNNEKEQFQWHGFRNSKEFLYYRMHIVTNYGSTSFTAIAGLKLIQSQEN